MLNYEQLKGILPHAYPFLLIDRVEEYKEGEHLTAIKNITSTEWCFGASGLDGPSPGGAPNSPIFPETLLIEAAAQAALVLYHVSKVKDGQRPRYFLGRVNADLKING